MPSVRTKAPADHWMGDLLSEVANLRHPQSAVGSLHDELRVNGEHAWREGTAPPNTLSTTAAGERRDPAGVFNLLGSQRGADALARWRDIAQCDAGILSCQ
jgi:hypothetical protein